MVPAVATAAAAVVVATVADDDDEVPLADEDIDNKAASATRVEDAAGNLGTAPDERERCCCASSLIEFWPVVLS